MMVMMGDRMRAELQRRETVSEIVIVGSISDW
jgi:hypothetical protein